MEDQEFAAVLVAMGHVNGLEVIENFLDEKWDLTLPLFNKISLLLASLKDTRLDSISREKVSKVSEKLHKLLCNCDDVRNDERAEAVLCEALMACTSLNDTVTGMVIDWLKLGIQTDHAAAESGARAGLGVTTSLRFLSVALDYQNCKEMIILEDVQCSELFQCVLEYIVDEKHPYNERLQALHVIPQFASSQTCLVTTFAQMIWKSIEINVDLRYYLMCLLIDMLLQSKSTSVAGNIIQSREFWVMVQRGLASDQSVDRKQALYVLKRIVAASQTESIELGELTHSTIFWWDKKDKDLLGMIWQDFFLLYEILQQKQVHIVKPALPRIKKLASYTGSLASEGGCTMLDVSWLGVVMKCLFHHDSITIIKLGVLECLEVDVTKCQLLTGRGLEILCGPLLDVLCDHAVYTRPLDEMLPGTLPPVAEALVPFLQQCQVVLADKTPAFLVQLLSSIAEKDIRTATPLVFIFHALVEVSPCSAWTDEALATMRQIVLKVLNVAQLIQRSAAQCMLLKVTTRHTCPGVSWRHLALLLAAVEQRGCLKRGNVLWRELCIWIPTVVQHALPDDGFDYHPLIEEIKQETQRCLSGDVSPVLRLDTKCLARFITLISDIKSINLRVFSSQDGNSGCVLGIMLKPLFETLSGIHSRTYLPIDHAEVALRLLVAVADELLPLTQTLVAEDGLVMDFSTSVLGCSEEILGFVQRRMFSVSEVSEIESYLVYHSTLQAIWKCASLKTGASSRAASTHLDSFILSCIKTLEYCDTQHSCITLQKAVILPALSIFLTNVTSVLTDTSQFGQRLVCSPTVVASMLQYTGSFDLSSVFQELSVRTEPKIGVQNGSNFQWGRLLANHVSALWKCLQALLIISALSEVKSLDEQLSSQLFSYTDIAVLDNPATALDASMNALECVKGPALVVVMGVMELLIPKVWSSHLSECRQALYAARNTVLESWRDHITFWPALEAYIKLSFQPFLLFQPPESPIHETLQELSSELVSLGESRLGVLNVVLAHCCQHWSRAIDGPNSLRAIESITTHLGLLQEGCIFGPLHKLGMKSLRYDGDIRSFVQSLGRDFPTNEIPDRNDCYVRIHCMTLLLKLLVNHHQTETIIWKLIDLFIQKDLEISHSKPLYHGNTLDHRIKHRLWEVILLLQNSCTDQGRVVWLFESAFDALVFDNQPSLRIMIECLLVRLLLQYPDKLLSLLWSHLEKDCGRRIGLVASLLNIAALTGCYLPTRQQKVAFFETAIPSVLPWVQTHHFAVRVHAQASLHKMWSHCKEQCLTELLNQHGIVEQCVHFSGLSNDAAKHKQRLLDNFIFSGLDPVKDFSIELIFHTLPRLTGITGEEWISPDSFTQVDNVFWSKQAPLPVMLPDSSRLRGCKPGLWISAEKKHPATEELPNVDQFNPIKEAEITAQSSRNLQKKIIPWELASDLGTSDLPIRDLVGTERRQTYTDGRRESSLVLVASLIDKAPNLGGLCRTCEVFAVDTLVLGNTRIIDDRMFQSLSVTAEKWLHILEVRPVHLATYLRSMSKKGYTIVGVEQTANSKCLTEYNFSQRSLLLLGNEREGIPAQLLSLLDDCVEIPQLGIIRSLNVHVSGALLVWEYTQQWRKLGHQYEHTEAKQE